MAGWFDFMFPAGDPVYGHDPELSKKVARAPSVLAQLLAPQGNPDLQVQHKTRAEKEYADLLQQRAQMQQQLAAERAARQGGVTSPSGPPISQADAEAGIPYLARAFAAQQGLMAADQSRAAAAPRRSYPIDAYGATPQERIRNVQNMNAAEGQQDFIMEQESPAEAVLGNMYTSGMIGMMDPKDVAALQNSVPGAKYDFAPDQGPQQAAADAAAARAQADQTAAEALRMRAETERRQAMQDAQLLPDIMRGRLFEQAGSVPPGSEQAKALEQRINQINEQQRQQQLQQQLRQQMRSRTPQMPVLGRHMTLQEMIQYGIV